MPIPWGSIAAAIPWSEVIRRTPDVLRGAKDAWGKLSREDRSPIPAPPADPLATLQARCDDLETRLQQSHEVIAQLAEQQAGLIAEVARIQKWNRWLTAAAIGMGGVLATMLIGSVAS